MRRPFDCPSFSTAFVTVQLGERDNDGSYQAALKTDPVMKLRNGVAYGFRIKVAS
jgi:hypothetical protein